jgi:hypothetical protein
LIGRAARVLCCGARRLCRATRSLRRLVDFANPRLILPRTLLRLFERSPHRIDLGIDLTHAGSDELLGRAGGRSANSEYRDGNGD